MNFFVMKLAIMVILIVVPCRGNPIAKETAKSLPTNALEHSSGQIELPDRPNTKIFWSDKVMQSHITKYLQVMLYWNDRKCILRVYHSISRGSH